MKLIHTNPLQDNPFVIIVQGYSRVLPYKSFVSEFLMDFESTEFSVLCVGTFSKAATHLPHSVPALPFVFNVISRYLKNNHDNSIDYLSSNITEILECSHIGEVKS